MADGLDEAREWLETMLLIRRFEERAGEMYAKNKVGGFLHLAIGEEATIVGAVRAMRDEDYLISTYRSHGHALARGTDPKKRDGRAVRQARPACPAAAAARCTCSTPSGASWAATGSSAATCRSRPASRCASDYRETEEVTVCVFGDGAANQGTFGETLNIAALWNLPVVFMVTNNQFGMGTALERHTAQTDLHKRGEGFGVPGLRCDGMDVGDTYEVMSEAIEQVRSRAHAGPRRGRHLPLPPGTRWPTPRSTAPRSRSRSGASSDPIKNFAEQARRRRPGGARRGGDEAHRRGRRVRRRLRLPAAGVDLRPRLRARRPGQGLVLRRQALGELTAARTSAERATDG